MTAKLLEELNAHVVATVMGKPVTRGELSTAFNRIAPKGNWKNPINAVVDIANDFDKALMSEAIIFFTGSVPKFLPRGGGKLPGCRYRVTAKGYYLTVGA
jgi:hypothetical protein